MRERRNWENEGVDDEDVKGRIKNVLRKTTIEAYIGVRKGSRGQITRHKRMTAFRRHPNGGDG